MPKWSKVVMKLFYFSRQPDENRFFCQKADDIIYLQKHIKRHQAQSVLTSKTHKSRPSWEVPRERVLHLTPTAQLLGKSCTQLTICAHKW